MNPQETTAINDGLELFHQLIEAKMQAEQWKAKYEELASKTPDEQLAIANEEAACWYLKYLNATDLNERHSKNHKVLVGEIEQFRKYKYAFEHMNKLCNHPRFIDGWSDLQLMMKLSEPELFADYETYTKIFKDDI